ncbi:MAG: hypothetical protein AABZ47_11455 [Planctomycetota bacterium]
MNRRTCGKIFVLASIGMAPFTTGARAGDGCQNQFEIDACKLGCGAAQGVCGGLCDFVSGACWVGCQAVFGVCNAGCSACDVACNIGCCPLPDFICNCGACRADCNGCRTSCNNNRRHCESDCNLDCDDCILDCESDCESICRPFRTIGEHCIPVIDRCADGLVCWPIPFPGENLPQCFPSEDDSIFPDDLCRSFYNSDIHQGALDSGLALTFGTGSGASVGLAVTTELGVVYGPDGRFGCYLSSCIGAGVLLDISTYSSVGAYTSYDVVPGQGISIVESAGIGVVSFATAQNLDLQGNLVGTADCISIGLGIPIAVGVYDCTTIVDTVGMRRPSDGALIPVTNSPPLALCQDVTLCADVNSCAAHASIDAGSLDVDGNPVMLTQIPPGPYGLGFQPVLLRAQDPSGAFDFCFASVTVDDCEPGSADIVIDGRVDLRDAALLFNCYRGGGEPSPVPPCDTARIDCDDDIDADDTRHFIPQMQGP